jgi:subtilisin family serine protease
VLDVAGAATVPGALVVRTEEAVGPSDRAAIAAAAGGVAGGRIAPDTFVVQVDDAAVASAAAELADLSGVAAVQPELVYRAADTEPDDVCWRASTCVAADGSALSGGQEELRAVGAQLAWDATHGSADVVVAVLDTAVETSPPHRDLVGKLLPGASFVRSRACTGPASARNHGTMAAGLIAAQPANGTDIAGLGWETRVLPVEVLDDCGGGSTSGVAAGIRFAADSGADIINLSLTGTVRDPTVSAAVAHARARGALVVAAAGNQGSSQRVWPAAELGVVAVAATGRAGTAAGDRIAPFSNHGSWVDIAAPGTDLIGLRRVGGSTGPFDGTTRASGTSFAAPLVSAAAALVLADEPGFGPEQVVARLAGSARPLGAGPQVLWGRLDVAAALSDPPPGYRLATAGGAVLGFGDAAGAAAGGRSPVVGLAAHVTGRGHWLARADGTVTPAGSAPALGSPPPLPAGSAAVGIAATPGGDGYWLATRDGRVLPFGAAPGLGSQAGSRLNQPIVAIASARRGDGYWLVARDGGIFTFGSAPFAGSTGGIRLNRPIVGMAPTPTGRGYWLVASDGGIFSFGDARFAGSTGAITLNQPIVGMAPTATGGGYWLVAADGGIFSFGDATFLGSAGGVRLDQPVVAMAGR